MEKIFRIILICDKHEKEEIVSKLPDNAEIQLQINAEEFDKNCDNMSDFEFNYVRTDFTIICSKQYMQISEILKKHDFIENVFYYLETANDRQYINLGTNIGYSMSELFNYDNYRMRNAIALEKSQIGEESRYKVKGQIYPFAYDQLGGFVGFPLSLVNYNKEEEYLDNRNRFTRVDMEVNPFDSVRVLALWMNLEEVLSKVRGSVAELGVYKGATASILAKYCEKYDRDLFLFDTFEGFCAADLVGIDENRDISFEIDSLDVVKKQVGEYKKVHYKKGYFPDSLDKKCNVPYAFVHIDCDLYLPIKSGLDYFSKRMVKGGMIVVHDYKSGCWDGATKAVDEFLDSKKWRKIIVPDISGTVFLIRA